MRRVARRGRVVGGAAEDWSAGRYGRAYRAVRVDATDRQDGHVVWRATLERDIEQPLHHGGRVARLHLTGDFVILEHPRQSVAAKQEQIARLHVADHDLGLDLGVGANRASEHMAHRVFGRLVLRQIAGVDQLLHLSVIGGDLAERPAPAQVEPAIASPDRREPGPAHQQRNHGRADVILVFGRLFEDEVVGVADDLGDGRGVAFEVAAQRRFGELPGHGARRPLAVVHPAHAVGDNPEALAAAGQERVLVLVAHRAGMADVGLEELAAAGLRHLTHLPAHLGPTFVVRQFMRSVRSAVNPARRCRDAPEAQTQVKQGGGDLQRPYW